MSWLLVVPDNIFWSCVGVVIKEAEFVVVYVDASVLSIVVPKVKDSVVDLFMVLFDIDSKDEEVFFSEIYNIQTTHSFSLLLAVI